jgi:hypothetical protein
MKKVELIEYGRNLYVKHSRVFESDRGMARITVTICDGYLDMMIQREHLGVWEVVSDEPGRTERAAKMSVDEYLEKGRHPIFKYVTTGQMLKTAQEAVNALKSVSEIYNDNEINKLRGGLK